jgi:hypothetical protein
MTVVVMPHEDLIRGVYHCSWFDGKKLVHGEFTEEDVDFISSICHASNRGLVIEAFSQQGKRPSIDDPAMVDWAGVPAAIKDSTRAGVRLALTRGEHYQAGESHAAWLKYKLAEGWTYGSEKSLGNKTHPNLVPFSELSLIEQLKDHVFIAVVRSIAVALNNYRTIEAAKAQTQGLG